jgi:4-diphosphocytidyl-2-C-methyl-D-erythritol kinase
MSDALRRVTPVVRVAPAKLNLTLAIIGRREDGFHALHSVMVPLEIADRLALAPAFAPGDRLHVARAATPDLGPPDMGPPDRNLVLRAIGAARAACRARGVDADLPALAARLEKRIPVAAGLGGGSSDAAAAIDAALEAWGVGGAVAHADRASIASSLGSDVPFFLAGGWALVEGRGERVTPLPAPRGPEPAVLLVTPGTGVSTAAVFAAFAGGARPAPGAALASSRHLAGELAAGMTAARFVERAGIMAVANDLAPATAAVAPSLVPFRRALGRLVGRPVAQSGSGPTLWVLYPSMAAAETAAIDVRAALAAGELPAAGERPPFVCATRVYAGDPGSPVDAGLDGLAPTTHDGGT